MNDALQARLHGGKPHCPVEFVIKAFAVAQGFLQQRTQCRVALLVGHGCAGDTE